MHTASRSTAAGCWLVAVLLAAGVPAARGQDYSVFGSAEGSAAVHYLGSWDPRFVLTGSAELSLHHRISYARGEGVLSHTLTIAPGGSVDHHISEAYVSLTPIPDLSVYAGRQRVEWGLGYAFSPADSLHPRPDRTADGLLAGEEPGLLGVSGVLSLGSDVSLTAALAADDAVVAASEAASSGIPADEPWRLVRSGVRSSAFVAPVQAAVSLVYQDERTFRPGAGVSVGLGPVVAYAEAAVELWNRAAYPTADSGGISWSTPDLWTPFPIASAGLQVPLSLGPVSGTATAEYLFYSPGYDNAAFAIVRDGIAAEPQPGEATPPLPRFLRRHYALITIQADVAGYVAVNASAFANLEDGSAAVSGGATLLLLSGIDLWLRAVTWFGAPDTELGMYPEQDSFPGRLTVTTGTTLHF